MSGLRHILFTMAFVAFAPICHAQYNNSGIAAGFFDSSESNSINFSNFHLPPLAVLYENAKQNPQILSLEKAQEIAQAEVAKQKRHIFSYVYGHASYSYGKTDMWGNNSSTASLYIKITNNLVTLKTQSEASAIYQGAGALNQEDFHQGNMTIEKFADTKLHEVSLVNSYQGMQTEITTDIITLELLTHTPILTNTTTDITLDDGNEKSERQIRKENKAIEKSIRKAAVADEKRYRKMEEAERNAAKKAQTQK